MGQLSRHLQTYLASPHVDPDTRIYVVIRTRQEPTRTVARLRGKGRPPASARRALEAAGVRGNILESPTFQPRRIIAGAPTVTVEVRAGELKRLARTAGVVYVRPLRVHRPHLNVSVGLLGVDATVQDKYDGAGVRVAVIDSGIDAKHPDLKGRVNLDLSRNFTDEGDPDDVTDGNGHGTHVAGIIGGAGPTYRGVAPGVEFLSCKVFKSNGAGGTEGAILQAIQWAVANKADVINYSGGYAPLDADGNPLIDPPWVWPADPMQEEVEFTKAMDAGTVAVVSAGNEGEQGRRATLSMPATCPAVVTVGALDKERALTEFSSVGPCLRSSLVSLADMVLTLTDDMKPTLQTVPKVDLVTPGGGVDRAAALAGGCFYLPGIISLLSSKADEKPACIVPERYVRLSGTSQAAPHLSGLAALVLGAAKARNLDLGPRRAYAVKRILMVASQPLDGYKDDEQGKGLPAWSGVEAVLDQLASGGMTVDGLLA
jgi:subtilisin family serine protease